MLFTCVRLTHSRFATRLKRCEHLAHLLFFWPGDSVTIALGMLIAFNKPFGVLSQFTREVPGHRTLAEFGFPSGVYPLGRLDADSEGLLLLSDEPDLNGALLHPTARHRRIYWAQVERVPTILDLGQLSRGLVIKGRRTMPCRAWKLEPQPELPPRDPPIRFRKSVPTSWVGLELVEGKNRQVRRMTAAVGYPTLRLIRVQIGQYRLGSLSPGHWIELSDAERAAVLRVEQPNAPRVERRDAKPFPS